MTEEIERENGVAVNMVVFVRGMVAHRAGLRARAKFGEARSK